MYATSISRLAAAALTTAALATLASTACNAATVGIARPQSSGPAFRGPGSFGSNAKAKKTLLYVGDNFNSQISVFDVTNVQNPKPIRVITQGLNGPQGITTDLHGNLYATNLYGNTVSVYAPGASTPKFTISTALSTPTDVKVDGAGNVYISNSPGLGAQSYVLEFPPGSNTPSNAWYTPAGNQAISGIALLDPNQPGLTPSIYAAYYTVNQSGFANGSIFSCYPGNSTCQNLGYNFGQTGGIAVEESPGLNLPFDFMIVDQYVPGVDNFQQGGPMTQLVTGGTPEFITLNHARNELFVADSFYGRVTEYSYPAGKVLNQYYPASGHENPFVAGVAVSPPSTYF